MQLSLHTHTPPRHGVPCVRYRCQFDRRVRHRLFVSSSVAAGAGAKRERAKLEESVLLGKSVGELEDLAVSCGQPKYRGKQLHQGILMGREAVDDIQNLPKCFREELGLKGMRTGRSKIHEVRKSKDGTVKFLLQLHDGLVVETVGIPAGRGKSSRMTACVSSQVGCPLKCSFCATGMGGFSRNLMAFEIIDQVLTVQEQMGRRVSNIVFMGMGEPLLNLKAVLEAYHVINKDIGIGARMVTISTVGVPNAIEKLAREKLQLTLALSLHAPNQKLRETLIPSAKAYPLDALLWDCSQYFNTTGRRVTFEYTVMAGVNDSSKMAEELCRLLARFRLRTHVNLLAWNPVDEVQYKRPTRKTMDEFKKILEDNGIACTIRMSRGLDASAACGQLRNQFQKVSILDGET